MKRGRSPSDSSTFATAKAAAPARTRLAAAKAVDSKDLGGDRAAVDMSEAPRMTYADIVRHVAANFGVKVGEVSPPGPNPYILSEERAREVLRKVGILTRAGKLALRYR